MAILRTLSVLVMICFSILLIGQTTSLRCYQCTSQSSSQTCEDGGSDDDGGSHEDDDDSTANSTSTSSNHVKDGCSACDIETKTHKNGKVMYKRRCLEGNVKKAATNSCTFEGVNQLCTTVCTTDLCNMAAALQTALIPFLSILCVAVVTKYSHWITFVKIKQFRKFASIYYM